MSEWMKRMIEKHTKMPANPPHEFTEMYHRNCKEHEAFGEPIYTREEYWQIWIKLSPEEKEIK